MSFSIREPRTRVSISERITLGIRKYYPDWLILLDVILIQSTLPRTESGVKVPTLAAKSAARMGHPRDFFRTGRWNGASTICLFLWRYFPYQRRRPPPGSRGGENHCRC